ncbi:MAG TPA: hypothetical protein PK629_05220 [Oscillospiraceae bacterium]|nr:hypothetical protein [Oscillospiraceae bacterium]HPF56579.1 hypothetical protein [Clostridiales bacterium]HPK36287.1 hypothetical protein [Oscillospiraceae bacterium]HPR75019.1 hypothetical protein [Oscillospiraceae bacterium]
MKFRLFLVVIFVLISAVIFLSDPLANKTAVAPGDETTGNTVSAVADETVAIQDEEVAMGVPGTSNISSRWVFLAVGITIVNLAGAIGIVFITSRDTSPV